MSKIVEKARSIPGSEMLDPEKASLADLEKRLGDLVIQYETHDSPDYRNMPEPMEAIAYAYLLLEKVKSAEVEMEQKVAKQVTVVEEKYKRMIEANKPAVQPAVPVVKRSKRG